MAVGDKYTNPQNAAGGLELYEETAARTGSSTPGAMRVVNVGAGASPSATLFSGSQPTSTTGEPLNGGDPQTIVEVLVSNTHASILMYVGNEDSQDTPIAAGGALSIPVDNLNKVYVRAASGTPSVAWLGRS